MRTGRKIFATFIFVFASGYFLSVFYSAGLKHNLNLKASFVASNNVSSDVLIHGPCEPLWMVNPAQLDSITGLHSYNLALSHSDFADNYLHLYLYLKRNKAPKLFLLYVTPESLDKKFNEFNSFRFSHFLSDDTVAMVVSECDPTYFKFSRGAFFNYFYYNKQLSFNTLQGIKHFNTKKRDPFFANGFEPPAKITWDNHLEDMKKQYPLGYHFKVDTLRLKYLKKTIDLAKSAGSKVVLFESPVLTESLSSLKNRDSVLSVIQNLALSSGVEYVLFKDEILSCSRDNYISSLNLNAKGLRVFNDTLAQFIKLKFKK